MSTSRLALLDVDGTLTPVRSVWQYLLERTDTWLGAGEENLSRYLEGAIGYEEFCQLDAALLRGVPYDELVAVAAEIPVNRGSVELVSGLRARGYEVALISTGLRVLTSTLCDRLGIGISIVNDLEVDGGHCTGRALVDIDESEKGIHARTLIERTGSSFTLAIGDGSGDLPMFREADLSIAVGDASPAVIAAADRYHPGFDLSGLLDVIDEALEVHA